MTKKVLFFSAGIGSGHERAAQSLAASFDTEEAEIAYLDVLNFLPSGWKRLFLAVYYGILRHCPGLYKLLYRWGDFGHSLFLRNCLNRFLRLRSAKYFRGQYFDEVCCTHPTALGVAVYWRQQGRIGELTGAVPAFTVHYWWAYEGVDCYYLADLNIPHDCLGKVKVEKCSFAKAGLKAEKAPASIVLVGGGGGLLPMAEIVKGLRQVTSAPIIVFCGHNQALAARLRTLKITDMTVFGYSTQLEQYMAGASLLITKAGFMTLTEAASLHIPTFIYGSLPGQEQANAQFAVQKFHMRAISDIQELQKAVLENRY